MTIAFMVIAVLMAIGLISENKGKQVGYTVVFAISAVAATTLKILGY